MFLVSFLSGTNISLINDCKVSHWGARDSYSPVVFFGCYLCLDGGDFVILAFSASSKSFVVSFGSSSSTV